MGGSCISTSCAAELDEAKRKAETFKRAFALKRISEMDDAGLLRELQLALACKWGGEWYGCALKDEAVKRKLNFGAS